LENIRTWKINFGLIVTAVVVTIMFPSIKASVVGYIYRYDFPTIKGLLVSEADLVTDSI